MIDERTRAALSRLTENERACLLRRLEHQTAKEMAIDLGISPHAVEKRLKMARTKLGVSSSLEAARLLERYGRTGPQTPDLGEQSGERQVNGDPVMPRAAWRRIAPYLLTGAVVMSFAIIAFLAVAPLNAPAPSTEDPVHPTVGSALKTFSEYRKEIGERPERPQMVKASPEVVKAFVDDLFDTQDKNHSGYMERDEAPNTLAQSTVIRKGPFPKPGERGPFPDVDEPVVVMKGPAAQAAFLATMDKDADGKVSREEYQAANYPRFLIWGVPANWNGTPKVAAK